jgi:regulator of RNase E activity RraA
MAVCATLKRLQRSICPHSEPNPSAPTNLTKHHAIDIDVPIGGGSAAVFPGDILVGDGDGVVVIPADIVGELATEAAGMEAWVMDQVRGGTSIIGLYPMDDTTRERFETTRAAKDPGKT